MLAHAILSSDAKFSDKEIIVLLLQENERLTTENIALKARIKELETLVLRLSKQTSILQGQLKITQDQLKLAQVNQFGKKSEVAVKLIGDDNTATEDEKLSADEMETVCSYERKKREKNTRLIDTDKLARYKVYHDLLNKNCPDCGDLLDCFGEDSSDQLEILTELLYVIENIRKKYCCRKCNKVFMGEKSNTPIQKGLAGASLLKSIILNKYEYHIPLYRQSKIFSRKGIEILDNVMGRWVAQVGESLMPLLDALWTVAVTSNYLQVDESPAKVLKPEKKGYFWCYLAPVAKVVFYELTLTRSGDVAKDRLKDFKGSLQTDGYSGYNFAKKQENITKFCCLSHARRKFTDVVKISNNKDGYAALMLSKMAPLYEIERYAKDHNLSFRLRKKLRQKKAFPILKDIKRFLEKIKHEVPPNSKLGGAISYSLKRWKELTRYTRHGEVEIDTNSVENKMRPIALGRKNWLAVGNEITGNISALFYSLIGTCVMNNINPGIYLHYILTQLHALRRKEVDPFSLLPHLINPKILEEFEKEQLDLARKVLSQNTTKEDTPSQHDPPT